MHLSIASDLNVDELEFSVICHFFWRVRKGNVSTLENFIFWTLLASRSKDLLALIACTFTLFFLIGFATSQFQAPAVVPIIFHFGYLRVVLISILL